MKNTTLLIAFLFCGLMAKADCANAYSSASYALSHAKQGLSANNFDHQRYYAERALEAFEKTQALTEDCGCNASEEPIWNGMQNLRKAIDPKDWEMGRYYTKKGLEEAQNLLTALDLCSSGQDEASTVSDFIEERPGAEAAKSADELEAQLELKRMAEITIYEFENSIRELAALVECNEAQNLSQSLEVKTEDDLRAESLEDTREFYRKQTIAIQKRVLKALALCSKEHTAEAVMEE